MNEAWCPFAEKNFARADGGAFVNPVTVGVLHKTISPPGSFRPNSRNYFGHQSYPHFTVDVQGGRFKCWQHISIKRAAKALRNEPGGVQTNREGVIQIEIVGWADKNPNLDPVMVAGLKKLMRWVEDNTFITPTCDVDFHPYPPPMRLGNEPWRMSFSQWVRYSGWCAHQHTPENTHGDVGALDKSQLFEKIPDVPVTPDLKIPKVKDMFLVDEPNTPRQFICDTNTKRWVKSTDELRGYYALGIPHLIEKPETITLRTALLGARTEVVPVD
jgi:N-acetylmuramoyl-L-alanine amidase